MRNILVIIMMFILGGVVMATPSTQIWNPSTDTQAPGTVHLGIDNYFTGVGIEDGGYALPTDVGITYGLMPGLEIGFDLFAPQTYPTAFNFKLAVPESVDLPIAAAVGGFGFGTKAEVTDYNVGYAVVAKTFPIGRFTAGLFQGNEQLLVDTKGNKDNSGGILTWDKQITDKLWLSIDHAGS